MSDHREEQISQLVDGELSKSESHSLFAHLSSCEHCGEFLRELLRLRENIQKAEVPEETDNLAARLAQLVEPKPFVLMKERAQSLPFWRRRLSLTAPWAVVTSLVLIALSSVASVIWFREVTKPPEERVVYIMALPEVEVRGEPLQGKSNGKELKP
jgi:anti-sigma factor RsiW